MAENPDAPDILGSRPLRKRWVLAAAGATTVLIALAISRGTAPRTTPEAAAPIRSATRPSAVSLRPLSIHSADQTVHRLSFRTASLRVLVVNGNDCPVTLLRVGQAVSGMSLYSVEPTPQRIPPLGTATVTVTFVRFPGLACNSVGADIVVVGQSSDLMIHRWLLPVYVHGQPWNEAVAAVMCGR